MGETIILVLLAVVGGSIIGYIVSESRKPVMRSICVECGKTDKITSWTTEKPTGYGWYWVKEYHEDEEPIILHMLGGVAFCEGKEWKEGKATFEEYEWQGPLQPKDPYYG